MFNFSKELAQWQRRVYQGSQLHDDLRTMCKKHPDDYNDVFVLCQRISILFGLLDAGTEIHKQLFSINAHLVHSTQSISCEVQPIKSLIFQQPQGQIKYVFLRQNGFNSAASSILHQPCTCLSAMKIFFPIAISAHD